MLWSDTSRPSGFSRGLCRGGEEGAEGRGERVCSYRDSSTNALASHLLPVCRHLCPGGDSDEIPGLARTKAGVLDPEPMADTLLDPQRSLGNCPPEYRSEISQIWPRVNSGQGCKGIYQMKKLSLSQEKPQLTSVPFNLVALGVTYPGHFSPRDNRALSFTKPIWGLGSTPANPWPSACPFIE